MKKTFFFLTSVLFIMVLAVACSKKAQQAGPLPASLQKLIAADTNCTCEPYLEQESWKGQVVYLFTCAGPACNCMSLYYDVNGNAIPVTTGDALQKMMAETTPVKTIWRCGQ